MASMKRVMEGLWEPLAVYSTSLRTAIFSSMAGKISQILFSGLQNSVKLQIQSELTGLMIQNCQWKTEQNRLIKWQSCCC